jgi:hypothetical protein
MSDPRKSSYGHGAWFLTNASWAEAGKITATMCISDPHGGDPIVLTSLADYGPITDLESVVVCNGTPYTGCTWNFFADGTVTIELPAECPTDEPVTLYNNGRQAQLDQHRTIKFPGCLLEIPAPS